MSYYTIDPVVNGQRKQQVVKVGDTLPIGAEIDYDGTSVPDGWEEVDGWEALTLTSAFKNYNNKLEIVPNSDTNSIVIVTSKKTISKKDLREMFDEQIAEGKPEELEIQCKFCNSRYAFRPDEVL